MADYKIIKITAGIVEHENLKEEATKNGMTINQFVVSFFSNLVLCIKGNK